jgi:1,4-dihydroxy-2-naphthoate octaprenyltransferase
LKRSKVWLQAFRPHTLPLAIAGIILGNALAFESKSWNWPAFLLTLVTAVSLQVLSNLANDYGDYKHGTDQNRQVGPVRMAQHGLISAVQMKKAILIFILLSFTSGLLLIIMSMPVIEVKGAMILFVFGVLSIAAAIAYTAVKKPYGYKALGDLSVFIFFGIVSVFGSYFLQTGELNGLVLLPAAALGLLSTAVLNINNIRDFEADRTGGKITVAGLLGEKTAKIYHWSLLLSAVTLFFLFTYFVVHNNLLLLFLIPSTLFVVNGIGVSKSNTPEEISPYLKHLVLSILAFIFIFSIGVIIF